MCHVGLVTDLQLLVFLLGVLLNITIGTELLRVRLGMFSDVYKSKTSGLLGNFNGNANDDFIPRGLTTSLNNPDEQTIFEQFGQTCKYAVSNNL